MAMEKFHHEIDGKKIVLPKFKFLPAGVIRKTRGQSEAEQIFSALEAVADEKTLDVIDALTAEAFNEFIVAWQKDSKVTAGE